MIVCRDTVKQERRRDSLQRQTHRRGVIVCRDTVTQKRRDSLQRDTITSHKTGGVIFCRDNLKKEGRRRDSLQ